MIDSYLKNVINKKYAYFDEEQKRNLFVLYVINLFLPITLLPWIYFHKKFDNLPIVYSLLIYITTYIIIYLASSAGKLNFKWYRFLMILTSMMVLTSPTIITGIDCICITGIIFVPIGMILSFSSKEKGIYIRYLIFITVHFLFFLYWAKVNGPYVKVSATIMDYTNFILLINFSLAALTMSYIYFNENSSLQTNLKSERGKSDKLLLKIFPATIANKLKGSQSSIVENFKSVTVIFIDIANFNQFADNMAPKDLVYMLDNLFSSFDLVAKKHQIEKIKTIGDEYMAVSGLPNQNAQHHINAANFVLEINKLVKAQFYHKHKLQIRIGMHTGSVIAGVIGKSKFSYDLWGSTVNIASRFESQGAIGKVHITKEMTALLQNEYKISFNGIIQVKGIGAKESYYLKGKI